MMGNRQGRGKRRNRLSADGPYMSGIPEKNIALTLVPRLEPGNEEKVKGLQDGSFFIQIL